MGPTGKNDGHIPDHCWLSASESECRSEVVGIESESDCEGMDVVSENEHERVRVNKAW